ncbi:sterol carrier family protein [Dietzia sp.]|uniref:sterol carrier family protein n=1 Tax=Dietzia sp. TaxID=1871616 RepID=UPI002FDB5A16
MAAQRKPPEHAEVLAALRDAEPWLREVADLRRQAESGEAAAAPGSPTPGTETPGPHRAAVAAAVRGTLAFLAGEAPGHSVEVRVPPFGAVQCVEGPRHTRGTPPNVVETDPGTWLLLATGELSWEAAVTANLLDLSGVRAGEVARSLPVARPRP